MFGMHERADLAELSPAQGPLPAAGREGEVGRRGRELEPQGPAHSDSFFVCLLEKRISDHYQMTGLKLRYRYPNGYLDFIFLLLAENNEKTGCRIDSLMVIGGVSAWRSELFNNFDNVLQ